MVLISIKENNKIAKELIALLISFDYKEIFRADNLIPVTVNHDFGNCHFDVIAK